MSRVKRGTIKNKHRKNILRKTKGFRFGRSTKKSMAKEAMVHAGNHAFRDRRKKKSVFRGLWNIKINAGLRANGTTYSKFIKTLKDKNILLNRKMLAEIAEYSPESFVRLVEKTK